MKNGELPSIIHMDKADYDIDMEKLHDGCVQFYHNVYGYSKTDKDEHELLERDPKDKTYYLVSQGRMVLVMNKGIDFYEEGIVDEDFIEHMAKHTDMTKTGCNINLSRKLPYKLCSVEIEGVWKYSDQPLHEIATGSSEHDLDSKYKKKYTLFSAGDTNLTNNKGSFFARSASTNYELGPEQSLVVVDFIIAKKPRLLKYPRIINLFSGWAIGHYLPKVVRRARNYDYNCNVN